MSNIFDKYFNMFAKEIDDTYLDQNLISEEDDEAILINDDETEDYLMYKLIEREG